MLQKVEICGVNTSALPVLSSKEQQELMLRLKSGDEQARQKFITCNLRLVLSLVRRFWAKNANADDVFQAGCVGLIKAIDNFDVTVGVKFSTYAVPIILVMRNGQKELILTDRQALFAVFSLCGENLPQIKKLKEIAENMPFTGWDEATIIDAVENFMAERGRLPTAGDFKKENGLPPNSVIKQRFKVNLSEWLNCNFPTYYKPAITRRQALEFAFEMLCSQPQAQDKIAKLLKEYPVCKWTTQRIAESVEDFRLQHGRLPSKAEFTRSNRLPEFWRIRGGLNALYTRTRDYKAEFTAEYNRIKPVNKADFDRRRNRNKCCGADVVIKRTGTDGWRGLLKQCGLTPYKKPCAKNILFGEAVLLSGNLNEDKRYSITIL